MTERVDTQTPVISPNRYFPSPALASPGLIVGCPSTSTAPVVGLTSTEFLDKGSFLYWSRSAPQFIQSINTGCPRLFHDGHGDLHLFQSRLHRWLSFKEANSWHHSDIYLLGLARPILFMVHALSLNTI